MASSGALPDSLFQALPDARDAFAVLQSFQFRLHDVDRGMNTVLKSGNAVTLARAFVVLHRLAADLDVLDKQFSAVFEKYKKELLPQVFEHEGVTSVPLAEGYRVGVSSKTWASIRSDRKAEAYAWLRANGLADIVTETVNSSTLSGAVRHMIEDENKEPPSDLFAVALVPTTSVTGTGK